MTSRIEGTPHGEIDVKRFYLPGVNVYSYCPECDTEHKKNLAVENFSYPVIGEKEDLYFYCKEDKKESKGYCDTQWSVGVTLGLTVKLTKE